MRISDASVALASAYTHRETFSSETSLRLWLGNERPAFEGDGPTSLPTTSDLVTLSQEALDRQNMVAQPSNSAEFDAPAPIEEDPKLHAIRLILEALTGKKIKVATFAPHKEEAAPPAPLTSAQTEATPQRQGWGLAYDYHEVYREVETVQFSASGEIHTADGQSLRFNLEFSMQREYVQETHLSIRAGDARLVDPLVINFGGNAAQLSDQRFAFDLDMDGRTEEMPLLGAGSGFLALDRNNDGRISSGAELFGPATGNGFAELKGFDNDGNGWLDENDPLFAKLRVWMKDAAGSDALYSLREKGIGALLLGSAATPFALGSATDAPLGQLRASSLHLGERGQVGTIQEIDVAV